MNLALIRRNSVLWYPRGDYSDPVVFGRIRLDPYVPGCQQEVLCPLLP